MLTIVLWIGLAGALLMFCGDMLLYYDRDDFEQNGSLQPIIDIMRRLPKRRVMLGGWLGPVAAFLYCIGFYHIVLIAEESYRTPAFAAFLLCCMGIISGGAYHSHCAYLGLLGEEKQKEDLDIALKYFQKLPIILYLGEGSGLLILLFLVVTRKAIVPAWMAVLTPGVLFLLRPLARKLPKGWHMILSGGFTNVIFVVYYLVLLVTT
ncbi:MAG: hypothetical protein IJ091_09290 [Oscillospiraceae bacterium]|nr:hypothetical protein [Oscillospiraceae bacterium]